MTEIAIYKENIKSDKFYICDSSTFMVHREIRFRFEFKVANEGAEGHYHQTEKAANYNMLYRSKKYVIVSYHKMGDLETIR